jgi:hypothetical protein
MFLNPKVQAYREPMCDHACDDQLSFASPEEIAAAANIMKMPSVSISWK